MAGVSRQKLVLVLVVVSALLSGGCFRAPEQRPAIDARSPLREVLRARAERFIAGDLEGFLANLSPLARAAEEPIARNAMVAEVSSLEFTIGETEPGPKGGLERVEIEWVYRYRGVPDDNVFRFRRLYRTEAQGNSALIIDSIEDPASVPPLWATGPVAIARSPHFLVLTRLAAPLVPAFLPAAEDARVTLLPKLEVEPFEPDDVHVVVLAANKAEYEEYLRGGRGDSAAVARYSLRPSGAENREMVVNGAAVLGSAPVAYEERTDVLGPEVVRHELGHLVLAKFTTATTPDWVAEGAAMYLSGERREASWREAVSNDFKKPVLSFGRLRAATNLSVEEYGYANAGVLYLIEQSGGPSLFWEFYQGIRRTGIDVALTRFYRTEDDRLDVQVQEWIRKQVADR